MQEVCLNYSDRTFLLRETDDDVFVVTAGLPFGDKGAANVIRVLPASGPQSFVSTESSEWSEEEP